MKRILTIQDIVRRKVLSDRSASDYFGNGR